MRTPVGLRWKPPVRLIAFIALIACYFTGPLQVLHDPEKADNHFVSTLRNRAARPGRPVEFDRNYYQQGPSGGLLRTFAKEDLEVEGVTLGRSKVISARGTFVSEKQVRIEEYHLHEPPIRDIANYIGLSLVGMLWFCAIWRGRFGGYIHR